MHAKSMDINFHGPEGDANTRINIIAEVRITEKPPFAPIAPIAINDTGIRRRPSRRFRIPSSADRRAEGWPKNPRGWEVACVV
jgi:hypothetical protein